MPIINALPQNGELSKQPDLCRNLSITGADKKCIISWEDPTKLKGDGTSKAIVWGCTILVRNTNHIPASISDGVIVLKSKIWNQYKTIGYEDTGLQSKTKYYYAVFPCSTNGAIGTGISASATTPESYDPVLENNSWEMIAKASEAGIASQLWSVGDEKKFRLTSSNMGYQEIAVQIAGFDIDTFDYSKKAGITFVCKNLLMEPKVMTSWSNNHYSYSDMYIYLSDIYRNYLPSDLRSVIKLIEKINGMGNNAMSGTYNTFEYLFLFAEIEVLGTTVYSFEGEANECYPIFADPNQRKKAVHGEDYQNWWTRSPVKGSPEGCITIDSNGTSYMTNCTSEKYICFGFCV